MEQGDRGRPRTRRLELRRLTAFPAGPINYEGSVTFQGQELQTPHLAQVASVNLSRNGPDPRQEARVGVPGWLCLRQRRVPGSNLGGGADKATLKGAHPATMEGGRNVKVNRCKERPRTAQGKEPGERRVLSGAGLPHGKGVLAGGGAVG